MRKKTVSQSNFRLYDLTIEECYPILDSSADKKVTHSARFYTLATCFGSRIIFSYIIFMYFAKLKFSYLLTCYLR